MAALRLYRAWRDDRIDANGVYVSTFDGTLSPCGEWVEDGEIRHRIGPEWHEREVDARASQADEIEAMGHRLIAQAQRLRDAAREEVRS